MTDKTPQPPQGTAASGAADTAKKPGKRLGIILREAREGMGHTLAMCEAQLRVKEEYLLALENGHYHVLPTATHAKGFLRTYAQFLGLGDKLAALNAKFIEETTDMAATPNLVLPVPMTEARAPSAPLIMGGIAAAVLVYVGYLWLSAPDEAPEPMAPPVAEAPAEPVAAAPTLVPMAETPAPAVAAETPAPAAEPAAEPAVAPVAEPVPAPEPAAAESAPAPESDEEEPAEAAVNNLPADARRAPVAVQITRDSWIQVQDEMGATIYSRLHAAGTAYIPPRQPGLTLTVGNAGGVRIVRKGVAGDALGRIAEVKRGIPLTAKDD